MLDLFQAGTLKLDELVTSRYTLEQVNQSYAHLVAGRTSVAWSSTASSLSGLLGVTLWVWP